MKLSIIGSSSKDTILKNSKISQEDLNALISQLGTYAASLAAELIIVPDEGIPFEIAKAYKEAGGHKVTGIVPLLDKKFGVEHIREFIGILDETVDVKTWYEADGEIASFGDLCICIGLSPGSLVEICMMKYHAKFLDKKIPLIIFENTFSGKLPEEIKEQLYELTYVQRMDELADVVKKKFLS